MPRAQDATTTIRLAPAEADGGEVDVRVVLVDAPDAPDAEARRMRVVERLVAAAARRKEPKG
jgi:hypothetical protein